MLSTSSPNKLFESMAASIPVIQTTNGWIKKMLQESQSGFSVSPTKEDELFDKLIFLADNEIEAKEIGKRGFEFARRNFDKNILSDRMIKAIEKIKDMVAQMPEETIEVDTIIDAINEPKQPEEEVQEPEPEDSQEAVEFDLNELSPSYAQLPIFDAVEPEPAQASLNDQLKIQGFQIGLNDRLAFVKNLFENSNEDYERVLSQLSTLDSYEEATNLLDSIIKPDYKNWEGQEEMEARFLEIIENKFK